MKLTPWFNGDVKPARPGVYQRFSDSQDLAEHYALWSGESWKWGKPSAEGAAVEEFDSWTQLAPGARWRGLAEEPK